MQVEKKYLNGLINADDDFSFVAPNEIVNGQNIRFGSTDDGAAGRFEKIKGMSLIFNGFEYVDINDPLEFFKNRGSVEDEARNRIIFFAWHNNAANKHAIYSYDKASGTTYTVLKEAQVTGGLGITENKYIDAVRVWGDLLIWTTGTGEVKIINIESGIKLNHGGYSTRAKAYVSPLKQEDIVLIKRPCLYAPTSEKIINTTFTSNSIGGEAWQFSYVYEYVDFQESVSGQWSLISQYNRKSELYNGITVKLPLTEDVPQTVRKVKLIAKQLSSGSVNVVKVWDKEITTENTEISTHNAGTVDGDRLSFTFYNNKVVETYSPVKAAKIEDLVSRNVNALEISNDRLFLGNYVSGFDGKGISSLTITPVTQNFAATPPNTYTMYQVLAIFKLYSGGIDFYFKGFFVNAPTLSPAGYYVLNGAYALNTATYPTVATPTTPVTLEKYCGTTLTWDILKYIYGNQILAATTFTTSTIGSVTENSASTSSLPNIFKSNSVRQVGICFYDQFNRLIEANAKDTNILTPTSTFGSILEDKTTGVLCTVSNTNAVNEIPDDAYYYSFILGENQVTRNFIEFKELDLKYGKKNSDGTYTVNQTALSGAEYLVIDTGSLYKNGISYVFEEGDLCRIGVQMTTLSNMVVKTLKIITQVGKVILCDLVDLGSLASSAYIANFEIFTPYKQSANDFLYEVANKYPVTNPGISGRVYSQLTHTIPGDTPFIERTDALGSVYLSESMSSNDGYWKRWFTNSGRPIALVKPRKTYQTNYVAWSGQYFIGTQINGVSTFELNNNQTLSIEAGAVRKLQTASRIQEEGGVMLAICERECLSLYVGRAQISDETQFNLLLKTDTVIGTVNGLRGSFGTKHPESVIEYRGNIYWFDVTNGAFVSYSGNGLFDISGYKFKRPTQLLAEKIRNYATDAIIGFVNFIPAGIDIKHDEVVWTIPKTETAAPKGELSDYTLTNYPYDIYDGVSKTYVYKIKADKWATPHTYVTEGFVSLNNELHSFYKGKLYKNNSTTSYNNFYGTSYASAVAFTINQNPSEVKIYKAAAVESNVVPTWTHLRTEFPNVQSSELVDTEWKQKESVYYSNLYKDRLSPNVSGSVDVKMVKGDDLIGQNLLCYMVFPYSGDQLQLRFLNIYYNGSYGHKV